MRRLPLVLILLSVVAYCSWRIFWSPDDVIEYRGQTIKLSKAYRDFDEYKNDPENIHPSETERVQRLVIGAPIGHSYESRLDLFEATGRIVFPGYGAGSSGGRLSDGTEFVAITIEIPRANKDRYLVFQDRYGRFELIDDFVNGEIAYPFEIRESDGAYIYVHDGKELFRRPRR